jgi:hypothetical protein
MDREDVERLVRVEQAVIRIDLTVTELKRLVIRNNLAATGLEAVMGFLVKVVPFAALGVAFAAFALR